MTDIPSHSIDVAIDKGTLDAMISGSLWDPPDVVRTNTKKYIDEVRLYRSQTQTLIIGSNVDVLLTTGCPGIETKWSLPVHHISTASLRQASYCTARGLESGGV